MQPSPQTDPVPPGREQWTRRKLPHIVQTLFEHEDHRRNINSAFPNFTDEQLTALVASQVKGGQEQMQAGIDATFAKYNLLQICKAMDTRHIHKVASADDPQNASFPAPLSDLPQTVLQQINDRCREDQLRQLSQLVEERESQAKQLEEVTTTELSTLHKRCELVTAASNASMK